MNAVMRNLAVRRTLRLVRRALVTKPELDSLQRYRRLKFEQCVSPGFFLARKA